MKRKWTIIFLNILFIGSAITWAEGQHYFMEDLSGRDFSHQDLQGTVFDYSNLSNARFDNAKIQDTQFINVTSRGFTSNQLASTKSYKDKDLRGLGLFKNDLRGWNFAEQNLIAASFSESDLTSANFESANLENAHFGKQDDILPLYYSSADLSGANFTNAWVQGANFGGYYAVGLLTSNQLYSTASYRTKNLAGIGFKERDLTEWDFSGQNLTAAQFEFASLYGVNFSNATIQGANFAGATYSGFTPDQLYDTESYQQRNLRGINLSQNYMTNWNFSGQDLSYANLSESTLTGANLRGANLHQARLAYEMPSFDILKGAVVDAYSVQTDGDILNQAGGHLRIYGRLSADNYRNDAGAILTFEMGYGVGGEKGYEEVLGHGPGLLLVEGRAEFAADATLGVFVDHSWITPDITPHYSLGTNQIVSAGELIVGGVSNPTDLSAFGIQNSLLHAEFFAKDHSIYAVIERLRIADVAGLEADSDMAKVCDAIDTSTDARAANMRQVFDSMSGEQQRKVLKQLYDQAPPVHNVIQKSQQQVSGLLAARGNAFRGSTGMATGSRNQPQGAAGPKAGDRELSGWNRTYGRWIERDGSDGFDANLWGQVIGLDRAYENWLLGGAGGFNRSNLNSDNGDSTDTDSWFGALYASYGTTDWFMDANLAYANSAVDSRSGTLFDVDSDFNAHTYSAYFGGGKAIRITDRVLLTPEAAVQLNYYDQPAYTENAEGSLPRSVAAYDRFSTITSLGANIATERNWLGMEWMPNAHLFWDHDFYADADRVDYEVAESSGTPSFNMQSPDKNSIRTGAGLDLKLGERSELGLDVDSTWSEHQKSLTVGATVRSRF